MNVSTEGIALFVAIITSAIGVASYVTKHLAEIKTDLKHAFKRIDSLEEAQKPIPVRRKRR